MTQINSLCVLNIKTCKTPFFSHRLKQRKIGREIQRANVVPCNISRNLWAVNISPVCAFPLHCLNETMVLRDSVRHLGRAVALSTSLCWLKLVGLFLA